MLTRHIDLSQLRSRAFENMVAIATCNYPKTVPDCNGNSSVFGDHQVVGRLAESGRTGQKEGEYMCFLSHKVLFTV